MGKIEQKDKTVRNKAFEGIAGSRKKKKTCTLTLLENLVDKRWFDWKTEATSILAHLFSIKLSKFNNYSRDNKYIKTAGVIYCITKSYNSARTLLCHLFSLLEDKGHAVPFYSQVIPPPPFFF